MDGENATSQGRTRNHHSHHVRGGQAPTEGQSTSPRLKWRRRARLAVGATAVLAAVGLAVAGYLARDRWLPAVRDAIALGGPKAVAPAADHPAEDHDHAAAAASEETDSLELSDKGRKNIGLTLVTVEPRDFRRTISVPAILVERPGRTELIVSAPMTGTISRIYPIRGEAVQPGQPLFDLRLTHEDLVEKQGLLLRQLEELDVVKRESARLEKLAGDGIVAGKRILEQQYDQGKREAAIRAEREALLLHGLTETQIDGIVTNRKLLQEITIAAPAPAHDEADHRHEDYLQVAGLSVNRGEQVTAGSRLATLNDHCLLYVEGKAFEHDAEALNEAANRNAAVTAVIEGNGSTPRAIENLRVLFVENAVERDSRALKFYLRLPNELVRNEVNPDGHRFIAWRYRPGQRVQVEVPVETWENRIVLPVEAVVQDGPEWFVFRQQSRRFVRVPVEVEHRDQRHAVVANDGTLFPGDVVAASGAYQIQLALKNKSGGGVDPHAGHHH